jgi:hypothetical protein
VARLETWDRPSVRTAHTQGGWADRLREEDKELNIIGRGCERLHGTCPTADQRPAVRALTSHVSHRNLTDEAKTACNEVICSGTR